MHPVPAANKALKGVMEVACRLYRPFIQLFEPGIECPMKKSKISMLKKSERNSF
jgi:hypothetical protein